MQEQLAHDVNSVIVGKQLLEYLGQKASWASVQPYLECVFAISDPATKASAGSEFAAE